MNFSDQLKAEIGAILKHRDEVVRTGVVDLYSDLVVSSPVDTGELRDSWQAPQQINAFTWKISNTAPHALIIDGGRRQVPTKNGNLKWIGSESLPHGYDPLIVKHNDLINTALKAIK